MCEYQDKELLLGSCGRCGRNAVLEHSPSLTLERQYSIRCINCTNSTNQGTLKEVIGSWWMDHAKRGSSVCSPEAISKFESKYADCLR